MPLPETCELDLCNDCSDYAHGISEHERGEDFPEAVTTAMSSYPMGTLTPGMKVALHGDECKIAWAETGSMADDCECEQTAFATTPCDTCGTPLAGQRATFTYWYPEGGQ